MKNARTSELVISGLGVTSAIGQGKSAFSSALMAGDTAFKVMEREGRQAQDTAFLGAEIPDLEIAESISKRLLRTASFSGKAALVTLLEAWQDACLDGVDPTRIGLVIGGSNLQQRELHQTHQAYGDRLHFLRPSYGLTFLDSDLCGMCTQQFGIKGVAYTLGGASASGQAALVQAAEMVESGQVDVCIAMGGLMDLSYWELAGFRALGAMGSIRFATEPERACRPFDKSRDGFIYGESCGAVVVERAASCEKRQLRPYGVLAGWSIAMDGNRNPDPSLEGEVRVIRAALEHAQLLPSNIDYVNPHGSGSLIGDEIELQALRESGLSHAFVNATKSIVGHGLSAAGTVEIIASLLQMGESRLHPTPNLEEPLEVDFNWVRDTSIAHDIRYAMNLSFGFGGINTAVCLGNPKK